MGTTAAKERRRFPIDAEPELQSWGRNPEMVRFLEALGTDARGSSTKVMASPFSSMTDGTRPHFHVFWWIWGGCRIMNLREDSADQTNGDRRQAGAG